ncbi:MAG: S8 family serine peptidase [Cyclobacteriaceae bacterium]
MTYRDSLQGWGIDERYFSNWITASSVKLSAGQLELLLKKQSIYIEKAGYLTINAQKPSTQQDLSFALEQINAQHLTTYGLTGNGVKIGIIDGGFLNAPKNRSLNSLFDRNRVVAYKDFITPDLPAYAGKSNLDDQHGTDVWVMLGGYHREKNIRYGLATDALYYLARTDHGAGEKRIEEEYFIKALAWMHEQGVRLINTSLGYTNGYDKASENYMPEQMDGSSAIAKATQYAIDKKGMIVVGAAGNEGNVPWKVINTPADARDVIAVGASKNTISDKMDYSSIGPSYLDYLKPELTCFSASGTSFAAPVITGLIACMLELNPDLDNKTIRDILFRSSKLYPFGNNYLGYGNPDARKILQYLTEDEEITQDIKPIYIAERKSLLSMIFRRNKISGQSFRFQPGNESVLVYHKYDSWKVIEKQLLIPEKRWLRIRRHPEATSTTVIAGNQIYELLWQHTAQ